MQTHTHTHINIETYRRILCTHSENRTRPAKRAKNSLATHKMSNKVRDPRNRYIHCTKSSPYYPTFQAHSFNVLELWIGSPILLITCGYKLNVWEAKVLNVSHKCRRNALIFPETSNKFRSRFCFLSLVSWNVKRKIEENLNCFGGSR